MRHNPIRAGKHTLYTKDEVDDLFSRHMGKSPKKSRSSSRSASGRTARSTSQASAPRGERRVQNTEAAVSYRQGLTIGSALGGLDNYCPAAVRPRGNVKFSNGDALTKMGLNRGQASEIIGALKGEKDKQDRMEIVLHYFEQYGVSCPL